MDILKRYRALEDQGYAIGFVFESASLALDQVEEELEEARAEVVLGNRAALEEELGDLIFAAMWVVREAGLDLERVLDRNLTKLERRFSALEDVLREVHVDSLAGLSWEEKKKLWAQAKHLVA